MHLTLLKGMYGAMCAVTDRYNDIGDVGLRRFGRSSGPGQIVRPKRPKPRFARGYPGFPLQNLTLLHVF
jgi:hypothetical protein